VAKVQTLVVTGNAGVTGNLNVSGNVAVTGTLGVTGLTTLTTAEIPTARVNNLTVSSDATIQGVAKVQTLVVTGNAGVTGNVTVGGTLSVGGKTTLNGALDILGVSSLRDVSVSGSIRVNDIYVTNNVTIGKEVNAQKVSGTTLEVTALSTLDRAEIATLRSYSLSVTQNTTLKGTLVVDGRTTLGMLVVTTDALLQRVSVTGNMTVLGLSELSEAKIPSLTVGALVVTGSMKIPEAYSNQLNVTGISTLGELFVVTANVAKLIVSQNALIPSISIGELLVTKNAYFSSPVVEFTGLTVLGLTETAIARMNTLNVTGNAVFRSDVSLLGGLSVANTATFNGTVSINTLSVNRAVFQGDVTINGSLRLGPNGKLDIATLLNVTPSTFVVGELTVTRQATLQQNLMVTGVVTANYFVGDGSRLTGISGGAWVSSTNSVSYPNKVGIGVTAPVAPLAIGDSGVPGSDGYLAFGKNDGATNRMIRMGLDQAFNFVIGDFGSNNTASTWVKQFKLDYRAPGNALAIDSVGNVGIGIASPDVKLDVSGTVRATAFSGSGAGLTTIPVTGLAQSGAITGQVLQWNGVTWVPATVSADSGGSGGSGSGGSASSGSSSLTQSNITISNPTTTIDWTQATVYKLQMTGINTTLTFVNPSGPARLMILIDYQVLGDVTWPLAPLIKWAGGIVPSLSNSQTQGSVDVVSLYFDGTTYYGSVGTNFR